MTRVPIESAQRQTDRQTACLQSFTPWWRVTSRYGAPTTGLATGVSYQSLAPISRHCLLIKTSTTTQ